MTPRIFVVTSAIAAVAMPFQLARADARDGDPAAVMQRVYAVYARESRGVIGFRSHARVRSSARIVQHDQVDEAVVITVDGRVVRSRGGTPNGPATSEYAAHQPYDPAFANEYRFSAAACAGCSPRLVAVAYEALAHDALHGRGVLVVDTSTARLIRTTTVPYVVPPPARSGSLATTWGATPAGWLPVVASGSFSGRVGPFSGHATLTQHFDGYARYATVAAAERLLP